MRFDIAFVYLMNRFFYRLGVFFVHWYGHTWIILRRIFRGPLIIIAAPFYIIWALIPVYLVVRIFYDAKILF